MYTRINLYLKTTTLVRRATLFPFSSLLFPCRCHSPLFPSMTSHRFDSLLRLPDSFSVPSKTKGEGLCVHSHSKVLHACMHTPASLVQLPRCKSHSNLNPLPGHKICFRTPSPYGGMEALVGVLCLLSEAANHEGRICEPLIDWLDVTGHKRTEVWLAHSAWWRCFALSQIPLVKKHQSTPQSSCIEFSAVEQTCLYEAQISLCSWATVWFYLRTAFVYLSWRLPIFSCIWTRREKQTS